MPTVEQVREALIDVKDPELNLGILELGLVYDVTTEGENGENVTVMMTLTSPMCPVGPMFKKSVEGSRSGGRGRQERQRRDHLHSAVGSAHDGLRRRQSHAGHLVGRFSVVALARGLR